MLKKKPKVAIAVSGKGRTLQNFLKGDHAFEVGAVIASNPKAKAVELAESVGLPLFVGDFNNDLAPSLDTWLVERDIQWITLAGFLKPFPTLTHFPNRVINIHPSLLPRFGGHGMYGMRVHEAVLAAQDTQSGATVHFVNERYDEGSIIAQAPLNILGLQTADAIAESIFALECIFYPEVLNRLIKNQLPLSEGRIWHFEKDQVC
ncbi:MAG: phosphoribosylglycinamide formyltransferase [Proteobacteria bacterium]|nr:MAG: phosphoribosylglycinamide formyltransferase [Pseudomonadota bacterium]